MACRDDGRRSLRVSAFWQALLVVLGAYLLFAYAFPPLMPRSLMIQFMIITVIGVLLYFSFDEERWTEFKSPIRAAMGEQRLWPVRWSLLLAVPALVAYVVYDAVTPSLEPPVELRQVHPAPPSKFSVYGRSYDLTSLENPVRTRILEQRRTDAQAAGQAYKDAVAAGSEVFYQNCLYCHGDLLNGGGPFARAFNPLPANFQDVGTIAQLQEAYVFWRITTGGPGLPREGGTWNSAMPVWSETLSEDEVWKVITFLFDYVGQVPRMWDQETSRAVSAMRDDTERRRRQMSARDLYQFRCAACHGDSGAGDGPAADFLYPRPRDFTLGLFKYKLSPGELPARDDDLFDTIKNGLRGTGMPAWSTLLSDAQIRSLIPVIKSFDITATWSPEDAPDEAFDDEGRYTREDFTAITAKEPLDGQVPYTQDSIALGEKVFDKVCKKCHGRRGRGNITSGKRLEDDWGSRIWPRDLTKPWSWRVTNVPGDDAAARQQTIGNIYSRLSIGIPGTPMPTQRAVEEGNEDPVSLADRWHVANYVYSLREEAAPPPADGALIIAARVDGALPDTGSDPAWDQARPVTIRLAPNVIKEERLFTPLSDAVSVRALYDDNDVAFLLEIDDRTDSRRGDETSEQIQDESLEMYPDAAAIQFPAEDAYVVSPTVIKPLFRHGDAARNTTIWYWNAGRIEPPVAARATLLDGSGPDQKLIPRTGDTDLTASGVWQDGRWRIVMRRPRDGTQNGDVSFQEGKFIPVSFASWDGSNGEVGARHTLSSWYWLLFPSQPNPAATYGLPSGSAALVFFAGLMLVRRQRRVADHGERTELDDRRE